MFHLAFPVRNLQESRTFYETVFNCKPGRINETWLDLYFFGHQLTLHERPDQVLPAEEQGVRHFGMVLEWEAWENICKRLQAQGVPVVLGPEISHLGKPQEQGKLFLRDPDHNGIELKTYRYPSEALKLPQDIEKV